MEEKSPKQLYGKLLFIYTAVIACVVLTLVGYFWNSTRNRYLEQNQADMERMQEEAEDYILECKKTADYLHEELYKSNMEMNDLLAYLSQTPEEYQKYRLNTYASYESLDYKGIEDFSQTSFEAYPALEDLSFVSYSKGDLTSFNGSQNIYHTEESKNVLERIKEEHLTCEGEISFLKEIRDPVTMQSMGAMVLTFGTEKFTQICNQELLPEVMITGQDGTFIYASQRTAAGKQVDLSAQNLYTATSKVEDYMITAWMKKSDARRVPWSVNLMIFGVAIVVMTIGEILVYCCLRRVSIRLNSILNGMSKVMCGDLTVRLSREKNGDELDMIAGHFNEMCEKLDMHIQKSYLAEIEQKNAEMAALQSQINPHFLYNTLEAIRMKAICNGDSEVGKMLYSMAVTFRSQLKEANIIPLAQELHFCKKYMELFEYRYPNQFQSNVECPLEDLQVPIIKFVLQPIIENYFIHGIRLREDDNRIQISVERQGEDYEIIVEDNGRGMEEEEIQKKNQQLKEDRWETRDSMGIFNVNRRVKAVYGNGYGVRMEAVETGGLRVILRFHPQEDKENEESNDSGR